MSGHFKLIVVCHNISYKLSESAINELKNKNPEIKISSPSSILETLILDYPDLSKHAFKGTP